MRQLEEILVEVSDLMESQQAMPDDGSVKQLRNLVREAYNLGQQHKLASIRQLLGASK